MDKKGNIRSKKLYGNVLGSALYKGFNVLFSLLIVRFSIQLIGEEHYGIWLTLLSFFTWFSAFEVGVSNSLRNAITLLFSEEKFQEIKPFILQGYKALILIYFGFISLLLLLSNFTTISQLVLPESIDYQEFNLTFQLSVVLYFAHFIFFFLHNVLLATHHTKSTYLITAIQNGTLLLGLILCHYYNYTPSLLLFCLWFSALPLFIWLFSSLYYYNSSFKNFKPRIVEVLNSKTKAFKGLNKDYFVIQICTLILFSTDNIIIVNLIGSYEVTIYNVTFKYFNILIILFNLVLVPYWASFTDAFGQKDKHWIASHMKKLMILFGGICLLGALMLVFSKFAFRIWIGKELKISMLLLLFMLFSVLLTAWTSVFAYFLNSVSKTKLQMRLLLFAALINVPLSIYLVNYFQLSGVIIATCISLLPQAVFLPLQCRSIMLKMK